MERVHRGVEIIPLAVKLNFVPGVIFGYSVRAGKSSEHAYAGYLPYAAHERKRFGVAVANRLVV